VQRGYRPELSRGRPRTGDARCPRRLRTAPARLLDYAAGPISAACPSGPSARADGTRADRADQDFASGCAGVGVEQPIARVAREPGVDRHRRSRNGKVHIRIIEWIQERRCGFRIAAFDRRIGRRRVSVDQSIGTRFAAAHHDRQSDSRSGGHPAIHGLSTLSRMRSCATVSGDDAMRR
jgi:hypothetical protein